MSTTGLGASLKYGATLFGYFFLILLLGGSGVTLGGVLAGPELQTLLAGGSADILALSGGLLIVGLGAALVLVGTFSITFKLISDAVSTGITDGVDSVDVSVTEFADDIEGVTLRDVTVKKAPEEAVFESPPEDVDADGHAPAADTSPSQPTGEVHENERTAEDHENPDAPPTEETAPQQEQSAEEIVFGTAAGGPTEPGTSPIKQAEAAETETASTATEPPTDVMGADPDERSGDDIAGSQSQPAATEPAPGEQDAAPEPPAPETESSSPTATETSDSSGEQRADESTLSTEAPEQEDIPSFDELAGDDVSDDEEAGSWKDDPLAD